MKFESPAPVGHVRVELDAGEALHVLHPESIIAYQGEPASREDRLMDLGGAYRKKKWIRAQLKGPSRFILGLPPGCSLEAIDIPESGSLLFDYRHVVMFTDGVKYRSKILKWRTAWITKELVRMQFFGPGKLGVLTVGDLAVLQLSPNEPLFIDKNALVAYPEDASIRLSVYGNTLATQNMNVQWEMQGVGPVLVQTGSRDRTMRDKLEEDGWLKRLLREVLPFGGFYIK